MKVPAGRSGHGVAPGEGAEGGQGGLTGVAHKAGQAQPVARWAAQVNDRVVVTGEHKVGGVGLRMVAGGERADQPGLVDHLNVQFCWWVARAVVVVAAHQRHAHNGVLLAPGSQRLHQLGCAASGGVQEVAEEDEVLRAVCGYE